MKKTLALLLTLALALSLCAGVSVFAAPGPDTPTGLGPRFFANGTTVTITSSAPVGGVSQTITGLDTGSGTFISWVSGAETHYVEVGPTMNVWGGGNDVDYTSSHVILNNGTVNQICGGARVAARSSSVGSSVVEINGGTVTGGVYGGGTTADAQYPTSVGTAQVTVAGGTMVDVIAGNAGADNTVSGSALMPASPVTGNAAVTITAGTVTGVIAAGTKNSSVDGTATINVSGLTSSTACYVMGGIVGNGKEGIIDPATKTITTNAYVGSAVVNVSNCQVDVVTGGGGGYTKVNAATVTIGDGSGTGDSIVNELYPAGINGSVGSSALTLNSDAVVTTLASTNRGYLGTGTVNINDGAAVTDLYTGAAPGCFSSDGNQASAVTGTITINVADGAAAGITHAHLSPNVNSDGSGGYTADLNNVVINNNDSTNDLALSADPIALGGSSPTLEEFTVDPGTAVQLNNVDLTIPNGTTLNNNGGVQIDADSSLTNAGAFVNAGSVANEGTITNTGAFDNKPTGTVTGGGSLPETVRLVTGGRNQTRTVRATSDMLITSNGDFAHKSKISVGPSGGALSDLEENVQYTWVSGSIKTTLKKAYLDTLAVGTYVYRVTYNDGSYAETNFTIATAPSPAAPSVSHANPSTSFDFWVWISGLFA